MKQVHTFLDTHLALGKPVLLAFSGGPDSSVLLDVLLEYRLKNFFELHLAHVDHGWREESGAEAEAMKEMAQRLQLPFHLKTLDVKALGGNLEDACRRERLQFFSELSAQFGFQAVLLGHHADDQVETVLKRVLEGASLANLRGIVPIANYGNMVLLRPLLGISKADIQDWVQKKQLDYLVDSTNSDVKFLRARMRHEILPALSAQFGKNIREPLARLGSEADELQAYLMEKTEQWWDKQVRAGDSLFLDLQDDVRTGRIHLMEMKYLFRRLAKSLGQSLTLPVLQKLCEAMAGGESDCSICFAGSRWIADRSRLFVIFIDRKQPSPARIALSEGIHQYAGWQVEVSQTEARAASSSWRECFTEAVEVFLPLGDYQLGAPKLSLPINGKPLSKWFTAHQVPVFMRIQTPVVWQGEKIVYEFLTGRPKQAIQGNCVHLLLKRIFW